MPSGTNRPQWLQATLRHTVQTDGDDMGDRPKLNFLPIFSLSDSQSGDSTNVGLDALTTSQLVTLTSNTGSLAGSRFLQSGSFTKVNDDTTGEVQIDVGPDPRYRFYEDDFIFSRTGLFALATGQFGDIGWQLHGQSATGIETEQAVSNAPGIARINTDQNNWSAFAPTNSLADDQINVNGIQMMAFRVKMGGSVGGKVVWLGAKNNLNPTGSSPGPTLAFVYNSLSGSNWMFEVTPSAGPNFVVDLGVAVPTNTSQMLSWERIGTGDDISVRINGNVVTQVTHSIADTSKITFGGMLSSSNGTAANRRLDIDYFCMKTTRQSRIF